MSYYSASVRVTDDTLHTSRPLTAPDEVRDLVESVVFAVTESGGKLIRVELEFDTAGESDTPVGDSIAATSVQPLHPDEVDEDAAPLTAPMPTVGVQG